MENLLKDIKDSPGYKELSEMYSEDQLKAFVEQYTAAQAAPDNVVDSEGGMNITPAPGFVVKTYDTSTKAKVFINICSHTAVELPEHKELPDEDEHVGLRVPLSLGPPHKETDNSGKVCTVYDVIVNPEVCEKAGSEPTTRQLLIELSISHISQKFKQDCSLSNL